MREPPLGQERGPDHALTPLSRGATIVKHDPPPPHAETPNNTPNAKPAPAGTRQTVMTVREARKLSKAKLKPADQIKVWTRSGGVCALCKAYLLEGKLTGLGVALGE